MDLRNRVITSVKKIHSKRINNYKVVRTNQFAYNPSRVNVGSIDRLKKHKVGALSPMYVVFSVDEEKLSPEYIEYFVRTHSFSEQVKHNTSGTVRDSLSYKSLERFQLYIPSLAIQEKIVEELKKIDLLIQISSQEIQHTEQLKKGVMQKLSTKGIGHTAFKNSKLGKIPEDWSMVSFDTTTNITNGQVDPKDEPYKHMILIAPNHIEQGTGRIISRITANKQKAISGKYLADKGDVLYSKIRPYLKKVTIAEENCLCSADMYPMKGAEGLSSEYLFQLLLGESFTKYANQLSVRTGIPKINRVEFASYSYALPPKPEQQKIVEILKSIDDKIRISQKLKAKQEELKRGLTQDLLTGKVAV